MNKRQFLFSLVIGSAVFVYLISSFLVATFNIALWKDEQRFFTVVVYLLIVGSFLKALAEPERQERSEPKQKIVVKEQEKQEVE
ncbi:hypothetical protein [Spirosoma areae]